jgi:stage V sporulation protein R
MQNFKDESFIAQYLSPQLMRDFRFFSVLDDDARDKLQVEAIHDERGYRALRKQLSEQYNLGSREPNIQVWNVDLRGDRSLTLRHFSQQRRPLDESSAAVLEHVAYLWGFSVRLEAQDSDEKVTLIAERMREKRNGSPSTSP